MLPVILFAWLSGLNLQPNLTELFFQNVNMPDYFNDDFRDFLQALNNNDVECILVGGMAVILYGYVRTTGDMDV